MQGSGKHLSYALDGEMRKVAVGDHICAPFVNEEAHNAATAAFVAGGFQRHERVLVIANATQRGVVAGSLLEQGFILEALESRQQLVWLPSEEVYGSSNKLDQTAICDWVKSQTTLSHELGFSGLRATGSPPPQQDPGALIAYEECVDEVNRLGGTTFMCAYCKPRMDPGVMRALIATHPQVWLQDRLFQNAFFTPPAFREKEHPDEKRQLNWTLNQILRSHDDTVQAVELESDISKSQDCKRLASRLASGIQHRDRLIGMLSRQMHESLTQLEIANPQTISEEGKEALERLGHLSERLESLSNLVSESVLLKPRTMDLTAMFGQQMHRFKSGLPPTAGPLKLLTEESVLVRLDERQTVRAFQLLLQLAVKHSCEGPIEVSVEKQGPIVKVFIAYQGFDGAGAAGALAGREGKPERYDWLGIDLFFAREIVRRMDGLLTVASRPDDTVLLVMELPSNTSSSFGVQVL